MLRLLNQQAMLLDSFFPKYALMIDDKLTNVSREERILQKANAWAFIKDDVFNEKEFETNFK